jgi:hypothetical protein
MFEVSPLDQGFSQIQIDLDKLFETKIEHKKFKNRFGPFMSSDPLSNGIIRLENNILIYKTEHIIPSCNDGRKNVLFLLGNPATHSVHTGVPFSYENKRNGGRKEHRFWEALRSTGYIDLPYNISVAEKKDLLFKLQYKSPIRFSLDVFFTLPSTASSTGKEAAPIQKKSGVLQIEYLLGRKALYKIGLKEQERLEDIIKKHDAVIVAQKDAYNGVKSNDSPKYDGKKIKKTGIETTTFNCVPLFCTPPTYLYRATTSQELLSSFRKKILEKL